MPEFVRVRDSVTKHEYTVGADAADALDGLTVLDKAATDSGGAPLDAKPHVTVASPARARKSRRKSKSSTTSGGAKKSTQATSAKAAASEEDTA